jgi:hypothetical protein
MQENPTMREYLHNFICSVSTRAERSMGTERSMETERKNAPSEHSPTKTRRHSASPTLFFPPIPEISISIRIKPFLEFVNAPQHMLDRFSDELIHVPR